MKCLRTFSRDQLRSPEVVQKVIHYSNRKQTGVTLQELYEFGTNISPSKLVHSANFLRNELPIRMATRVMDLENLPHGLSDMPSIKLVKEMYTRSFAEISSFPLINNPEQEKHFNNLLIDIKNRHSGVLFSMARGVHEFKQKVLNSALGSSINEINSQFPFYDEHATDIDIHEFLDNFFMSRIGIRMLIGQHIALHEPESGWVGVICETTSPAEIALAAIDTARILCLREYGVVPDVAVHGHTDLTMPFVPSHLHHMLFEVVKNSMRAVVEYHGIDEDSMPPIRIVISDGKDNEDVCIKISDEGGGIPRSSLPKIWSYMYTTATSQAFELLHSSPQDFGGETPLAGLGYGLPISRLFARYFGGDLHVLSMEGYGTDAYLHLKRVGDASEPLP